MSNRSHHVCPVEIAGSLDNRLRRWIQNPQRILGPYIREGMIVLDLGCGPGFFSIEIAQMVGKSGHIIAADLQEGMLQKVRHKIVGTELEDRITLHQCEEDRIGVFIPVDFVLLFYMAHEVTNQEGFLAEIVKILNPNGQVFIVEPLFHVSRKAFEDTIKNASRAGLVVVDRPKMFMSKTAILAKEA